MKLILDFGNSWQKCALIDGDRTEITVFENISVEDVQNLVKGKEITAAILSSVIDEVPGLTAWLKEQFYFVELTRHTHLPIANHYATPATLGKDRLADAVGAASLFPGENVLSVDCGTAIKYDLVTAAGAYKGGGISPGLWLRFKALHTFTDKLPLAPYVQQPDLTGIDTVTSIQSGVINGAVCEVNGIIEEYRQRYENLKVILTGGEMIYFEKSLKSNIFAVPNLVIIGLTQILKFNEANKGD